MLLKHQPSWHGHPTSSQQLSPVSSTVVSGATGVPIHTGTSSGRDPRMRRGGARLNGSRRSSGRPRRGIHRRCTHVRPSFLSKSKLVSLQTEAEASEVSGAGSDVGGGLMGVGHGQLDNARHSIGDQCDGSASVRIL